MSLSNCTCGPYMSVIPPEPCPIHDPERAYWRMKLLQEFGGKSYTTNTTLPQRDPFYHFMPDGQQDTTLCGAPAHTWVRVPEWVRCDECKKHLEMMK